MKQQTCSFGVFVIGLQFKVCPGPKLGGAGADRVKLIHQWLFSYSVTFSLFLSKSQKVVQVQVTSCNPQKSLLF